MGRLDTAAEHVKGDILYVASPEGIQRIALKVLRTFRFLYAPGGPHPRFVAMTDDDTYVCIPLLMVRVEHSISASEPSAVGRGSEEAGDRTPWAYLGEMGVEKRVRLRPGELWEDLPHLRLFGRATYPIYAQGALYVLSAPVARAVVDLASSLHLFNSTSELSSELIPRNEDALVGTLLHYTPEAKIEQLVYLGSKSGFDTVQSAAHIHHLHIRVYPHRTVSNGDAISSVRRENGFACSSGYARSTSSLHGH